MEGEEKGERDRGGGGGVKRGGRLYLVNAKNLSLR